VNHHAIRRASFVLALLLLISILLPFSTKAQQPSALGQTTPVKSASLTTPKLAGGGGGEEEEEEDLPDERNAAFYLRRVAGDPGFSMTDAAQKRAEAADAISAPNLRQRPSSPDVISGPWTAQGPDPIVQEVRSDGSLAAMSGRVSALQIRSTAPYTMYLGGAQGGVWISSTLTTKWQYAANQFTTLSIGAIALAPSNEDIVYVGTGEGSFSGDSYFGNGIYKSTDAGATWAKVNVNTEFNQVSIAHLAVDPANPNHLYAATLRGRAGARRTSPPNLPPFGIYESTDGGVNWVGRRTTSSAFGATDVVVDPFDGNTVYATFMGEGIFKSTDANHATWTKVMNGLPTTADYSIIPSRFTLGISRPTVGVSATLYVGFEWAAATTPFTETPSRVWKSTNDANSWSLTSTAVVEDYCGTQCTYDNQIGVDPNNPNIVFALGLFNYDTGTGGVFRSLDGGASWRDLGWGLHPDYHAIAFNKNLTKAGNVVVGNDGGVWASQNYGGRMLPTDPINAVDWQNLNGAIDPTTGAGTGTGLEITQFTSIGLHPINNRLYGGTQDNGTLRKLNSNGSSRWFDFPSGDGGQVLVDPYNPNYVYGTYYEESPYRFSEGMQTFSGNESIRAGINRADRSDFYVPFIMDPEHTERLYLGTYRVYRTDNRGDSWTAISGDLTSGCTGPAPNGARGCVISAFGPNAGSPALYTGSLDGRIYLSTDATAATPVWTRVDKAPLPARPVSAFAVDRSNYRIAYVAYNSFNAATPSQPGHVFKTTDGGTTWVNISGNLLDVPVNSIILDATDNNTLYIGTDVGPMMSTDGGTTWTAMGTNFPIVAIWQLANNPFTGRIAAGTHGRGAWTITNPTARPALQLRGAATELPVGPNGLITYTLTLKNVGNAAATGVQISDPLPANTTFVSASNGGTLQGANIVWSGLNVPAATPSANLPPSNAPGLVPGVTTVTVTVRTSGSVVTGNIITNDLITANSNEQTGISSSPIYVTIAAPFGLTVSPTQLLDGARPGQVITYTVTVYNKGYQVDTVLLSASGNAWPVTFWNANFTTQLSSLANVTGGETRTFGVKVTVPATACNDQEDTAQITVRSNGNTTLSTLVTIKSLAVTRDILLVDNSGDPDLQSYYTAALDAYTPGGAQYDLWDLSANATLPPTYTKAHKIIVWFTGPAYPGPITPYEDQLAGFLDNGGRLFMSGQDILDQSAGTTAFVHDYLHIDWDGSETQNDKPTVSATAVVTNTVFNGMGTIALDVPAVLGDDYSDRITPIAPAVPAFRDDDGFDNALTVTAGNYKVVFLAFPFEAIVSPAHRAEVMKRSLNYFGFVETAVECPIKLYLPLIRK
jgi:uncharacterized repeat protein (TIGR01451 family)